MTVSAGMLAEVILLVLRDLTAALTTVPEEMIVNRGINDSMPVFTSWEIHYPSQRGGVRCRESFKPRAKDAAPIKTG
jgi:hypothetical protein